MLWSAELLICTCSAAMAEAWPSAASPGSGSHRPSRDRCDNCRRSHVRCPTRGLGAPCAPASSPYLRRHRAERHCAVCTYLHSETRCPVCLHVRRSSPDSPYDPPFTPQKRRAPKVSPKSSALSPKSAAPLHTTPPGACTGTQEQGFMCGNEYASSKSLLSPKVSALRDVPLLGYIECGFGARPVPAAETSPVFCRTCGCRP